eukprot:jgi/Chlat1/4246/Chrsp27S04317
MKRDRKEQARAAVIVGGAGGGIAAAAAVAGVAGVAAGASAIAPPAEKRARSARSKAKAETLSRREAPVKAALKRLLQTEAPTLSHTLKVLFPSGSAHAVVGNGDLPLPERLVRLGEQLCLVGTQLARERDSQHNSSTWPLTRDLSIQIFSLLGVSSLARAAATCSLFRNIAIDGMCHSHLDLTLCWGKIDNTILNRLLQRAGPHLRCLMLGQLPDKVHNTQDAHNVVCDCPMAYAAPSPPPKKVPRLLLYSSPQCRTPSTSAGPTPQRVEERTDESSFKPAPAFVDKALPISRLLRNEPGGPLLTKSCLDSLERFGASRSLRNLCLYNLPIDSLDVRAICSAVASCRNLERLEVVALYVYLTDIVECVAQHCPKLISLQLQLPKGSSLSHPWNLPGRLDSLKVSICHQLTRGCPKLKQLSLRNLILQDRKVEVFMKELSLERLDLSGADYLTGSFLRALSCSKSSGLKSIVLRDCLRLKETEVQKFCEELVLGACPSLVHLDVSNREGLAASEWFERRRSLGPGLEQAVGSLAGSRPQLCISADFPDHTDSESAEDSDRSDAFFTSDDEGSDDDPDGLSDDDMLFSDEDDEDDEDDHHDDGLFSDGEDPNLFLSDESLSMDSSGYSESSHDTESTEDTEHSAESGPGAV